MVQKKLLILFKDVNYIFIKLFLVKCEVKIFISLKY